MKLKYAQTKWFFAALALGVVVHGAEVLAQSAPAPASPKAESGSDNTIRPIRVAVFDVGVVKGVDVDPGALTDQVNMILSVMPEVTVANRDQLKKAADEHKMSLSGLVDSQAAVQLGKFVSAQYVIVGRASKIGSTYFWVLKIVDTETTIQELVSVKATVDQGLETLVERLMPVLTHKIAELQKPFTNEERSNLDRIKKLAAFMEGKTVLLDIPEKHLSRPLTDPAATMAISHHLQSLGVRVVIPKDPLEGWKAALLDTGMYRDQKVDFLLEGEALSAFAAEIQGLVSCRARVELRLLPLPGHKVQVVERGVDSHVDLVEAFAAKIALEKAGVQAFDALIERLASAQQKQPDQPASRPG